MAHHDCARAHRWWVSSHNGVRIQRTRTHRDCALCAPSLAIHLTPFTRTHSDTGMQAPWFRQPYLHHKQHRSTSITHHHLGLYRPGIDQRRPHALAAGRADFISIHISPTLSPSVVPTKHRFPNRSYMIIHRTKQPTVDIDYVDHDRAADHSATLTRVDHVSMHAHAFTKACLSQAHQHAARCCTLPPPRNRITDAHNLSSVRAHQHTADARCFSVRHIVLPPTGAVHAP